MLVNPVVMEEFKKPKKKTSRAVSAWKAKRGAKKEPSVYVETKVEKRRS